MLLRGDAGKPRSSAIASPIEWKSAAGKSARTKRQHVDARVRLLQPLEVAREHFEVGQQVVRPQHRLRAPQVSIAGNHGVRIFPRQSQQRFQQLAEAAPASLPHETRR